MEMINCNDKMILVVFSNDENGCYTLLDIDIDFERA